MDFLKCGSIPLSKFHMDNRGQKPRFRPKDSFRLALEELESRSVPSILASGTSLNAVEGTSFSGVVGTFTDTDPSARIANFSTSIVWGDGATSSGTVQATTNGFQVIGDHTYADEGSNTISATINDIDGSSGTATSMAQVADNDAITATGYNLSGLEGQQVNGIVATFTDVTNPTNLPGDLTANINWGDGSTTAGIVSLQGNLYVVRGMHAYVEIGSYSISVAIQDDGSGVASASTTSSVSISDAPLTAVGTPVTATETLGFTNQQAATFAQVATFSDADPNAISIDFTANINWGNGNTSGAAIDALGNGKFEVLGPVLDPTVSQLIYSEEGQFTVTTTIKDKDGSQVVATSPATVADAPLTATGTPVHTSQGVYFSGQVATFTDSNGNATLADFTSTIVFPVYWLGPIFGGSTVYIDWGDGSTSNATVTQPGGHDTQFVVSGDHAYVRSGSYTISVSITDNGHSTAKATATATVAGPSSILGRVDQNGQIWSGVTTGSSFNSSLWATLNPNVTWVDVLTGDFTGDGRTDIAARDLETGQWWVAVSTGSSFTTTLWDTWNPNVTWVNVQVGDFNGDGKVDIIGRPFGEGHWWVAQSTGSSFTHSLWATWGPTVNWVDVKEGDFNGDGKADITARDLNTGAWWTGVSTGSSFTTSLWASWSTAVTWVDVQVGDFNGDGKADITGRALETGEWWTGLSNGAGFTSSLWATWSTAVTWVDVHVGDFNNDGASDIIGRDLETGQWWVGLSQDRVPAPDLIVLPFNQVSSVGAYPISRPSCATTLWATWSTAVTWVDVQVGDFNGDGMSDITGRALETGQWWTGLSNGTSFTTNLWATWSTAAIWTDVRSGSFA